MTQILVVTTNPAAAETVVNLLRARGYGVTSANGFQAAVEALNDHAPEFLISDLRLGAFNALHLAIRHRDDHPGMQTIVLDCAHDADIEREASRHGALYLVEPIDANDLLHRISVKLKDDGPPRRWPRKSPANLVTARVDSREIRIIDLSYCGARLEVEEGFEFPATFDLTVPDRNVIIRVRCVWTRLASKGWLRCGADLIDDDPKRIETWRRFVDSVEGS